MHVIVRVARMPSCFVIKFCPSSLSEPPFEHPSDKPYLRTVPGFVCHCQIKALTDWPAMLIISLRGSALNLLSGGASLIGLALGVPYPTRHKHTLFFMLAVGRKTSLQYPPLPTPLLPFSCCTWNLVPDAVRLRGKQKGANLLCSGKESTMSKSPGKKTSCFSYIMKMKV